MNLLWVYIGFAVVALLLVLLLARVVGNSQRRRIRKQLGLPLNSRLSPQEALAFVRLRTRHQAEEVVSNNVGHAAAVHGA